MPKEQKYSFKKDEDRNTILVIGVLVILIVIVGAALFLIITKKEEMPQPPSNQTNITPPIANQTNITPTCDDSCIYERAVANQNFSDCLEISNETMQEDCYGVLADVSLDACLLVTNETKKTACITAFAVAENDISLCDELADGSSCGAAVDPCLAAADQNLCRALKNNDSSECEGDTGCLLNYSITREDSDSCNLIQNNVISKACYSAIRLTDRCTALSKQAEKDYCYQLFAIYSNDYLTCTQITPDSSYALDCFSIFAARLHNVSICDDDGFSLNSLWACYINYSLLSGDLEGCRQIDELATTNRFTCAYEYAKKYGDPSACNIITASVSQRTTCYQGAIIYYPENLNWSHCAAVPDFDWKNKCYTESAKKYDDVSLCDYIGAEYAKEACRNAYEVSKAG